MKPKTIEDFKAELKAQGKTATQWAKEHNFPVWAVQRVMARMNKGHYGRSHDILVAAGIKPEWQHDDAA